MRVLNLITKEFVVAGGVVRDIIAPIAMLTKPEDQYMTKYFVELLSKVEYIDVDDIDIIFTVAEYNRNLWNKLSTLLKNNEWMVESDDVFDNELAILNRPLRVISDGDNNMDDVYYVSSIYVSDVLSGDGEKIKIDILLIEKENKFYDFDVNNLTWGYKDGFGLLCKKYIPKNNMYINNHQYMYVYIQSIIDKIIKKECECLDAFMKCDTKRKFMRNSRMISAGYTITNGDDVVHDIQTKIIIYDVAEEKHNNGDESVGCYICMETLRDGDCVLQLCNSKVPHYHHAACLFTWWRHARGNNVGCTMCKNNLD
jgi:hypothetical protein